MAGQYGHYKTAPVSRPADGIPWQFVSGSWVKLPSVQFTNAPAAPQELVYFQSFNNTV
jgi:hypothetical protein